ncbi:MAG: hypothetical protein QM725_15235 [Lacibacter sp.]
MNSKYLIAFLFLIHMQVSSAQSFSFRNKNEIFNSIKGKWFLQSHESDSTHYVFHRINYGKVFINFVDTTYYEYLCPTGIQIDQMTSCNEKWFFKKVDTLFLQKKSHITAFEIEKITESNLVLKPLFQAF